MLKKYLPKFNALLLGIILAQILIYHKFLALSIVFWVTTSIVNLILNKPKLRWNNLRFLFVVLYVLYIVGVFYSINKSNAMFDLEVKMSLVIFPLFISFTNYTVAHIRLLLYVFIGGAILSILLLLGNATINYLETGASGFFFYNRLSPVVHPSYFSFYMNVIMMLLIYDYTTGKLNLFKRYVHIIIFTFFTLFIALLTAKIALLTTFVLLCILLGYWVKNSKWTAVLLFAVGSLGLFGTIYTQSDFAKERINDFFNAFELKGTERYLYSTGLRRAIWQNAWDLYSEKPILGYGTGDVTDNLMVKYAQNNNLNALDKRLNTHNQFLQTAIAIGLGGLICMVLLMLIPLLYFRRNILFAGFVVMTIFFLLTESAFETQAGVIGILLLYSLLSVNPLAENKNNKVQSY